ncbi:MAG: hypothetical protein R8K48_00870 [Gallionella sp.]
MNVSAFSKSVGVTAETVRYYTRIRRTIARHRLWLGCTDLLGCGHYGVSAHRITLSQNQLK